MLPTSVTSHSKYEVKRVGRYLEVDSAGYIVKQASHSTLQPRWRPVIDRVVEIFVHRYGEALHSVYVRGSVAAGQAIDDVSDLDSICVVKELSEQVVVRPVAAMTAALRTAFPFVVRFELLTRSLQQVRAKRSLQMGIAIESVCMTGQDLSSEFARFRIGAESAFEFRDVCDGVRSCIRRLLTDSDPGVVSEHCAWITRRILRAGFELVMERERRYTRDLYLCYESFSKYYPPYSDEMLAILTLAVKPTFERLVLLKTLCGCLRWLEPAIAGVYSTDLTARTRSRI